MKILKIYEEYINSAANRITTFLGNLVQSLKASFTGVNNSLGEKDLESLNLIDIEQSNSNDNFEKNVLMRFSDMNYQYQMIFVIKLEDVNKNKPIEKAYMKLKIYDNNGNLLREWQKNLKVKEASDKEINDEGRWYVKVGVSDSESDNDSHLDFIEHFILEKIGFLKEFLEKENADENGPQEEL